MESKEEYSKIEYLSGFYAEERDDFYKFRWMEKSGKIKIKNSNNLKYLQFNCFSNFRDLSQELKVIFKDKLFFEGKLLHQWQTLTFKIPESENELEFSFETNKIFPPFYYPEDKRKLSVRLGNFILHNEKEKYLSVKNSYENALLNIKEMSEGKVILSSFPQNLGIDLYEKCNIKPPCVYCLWDENKIMEGSFEDIKVNDETFSSYGDFYFKARKLINCSIGEPFLNPSIEKIINLFNRDEKIMEISTNGHCFTERVLKFIEGKKLIIYISLDAGTEETYKKLRNDHFKKVEESLKKLKYIRKDLWPKIYLVFMPMKVNLGDLEAFFNLGKEILADFIVLRPLIVVGDKRKPVLRGGYKFVYNDEILSYKDYLKIWEKALELSEKYKVHAINQLFFGIEEKNKKEEKIPEEANLCSIPYPICKEPWENYYILRRGILPCCYGFKPIADMNSFADAWNSKEIQEIRNYLAKGNLSPYCLNSKSCPIVMRYEEKKENPIKKFFHFFKK